MRKGIDTMFTAGLIQPAEAAVTQMIDYSDNVDSPRLCSSCVEDKFLKALVQNEGARGKCSFCGTIQQAVAIMAVADLVEKAIRDHFERTPTRPSKIDRFMMQRSELRSWKRTGEPLQRVVSRIAGVEKDVAKSIATILSNRQSNLPPEASPWEETEFAPESRYAEKPVSPSNWFQFEWSALERRLQTECRFFCHSLRDILDTVFAGIEELNTTEGVPVIRSIGPQTNIERLYRARVFQTNEPVTDQSLLEALKRPDREVGPPPIGKSWAGRMNANGISVFYGALRPETALAEVRPPVGSHVAVAAFQVIRSIRVLDLEGLQEVVLPKSHFDPAYQLLREREAFLKHLSNHMTRPVMPELAHRDYLLTQVIGDYLATERKLHGLLYPSAQMRRDLPAENRTNVVLFHLASRVEELLPKGTESTVDQWVEKEGTWDSEILICDGYPPAQAPEEENASENQLGPWGPDVDQREVSLQLCKDDVAVHRVDAVSFKCSESRVHRHWFSDDEDGDPGM